MLNSFVSETRWEDDVAVVTQLMACCVSLTCWTVSSQRLIHQLCFISACNSATSCCIITTSQRELCVTWWTSEMFKGVFLYFGRCSVSPLLPVCLLSFHQSCQQLQTDTGSTWTYHSSTTHHVKETSNLDMRKRLSEELVNRAKNNLTWTHSLLPAPHVSLSLLDQLRSKQQQTVIDYDQLNKINTCRGWRPWRGQVIRSNRKWHDHQTGNTIHW